MTTNDAKREITKQVRDRENVRMTVIGVRVTYKEDDWVTQRAVREGLSRPDVLREALIYYMRHVARLERAAEVRLEEAATHGTQE